MRTMALLTTTPMRRMAPTAPRKSRSLPASHVNPGDADAGEGDGDDDGEGKDEAFEEEAHEQVDEDDGQGAGEDHVGELLVDGLRLTAVPKVTPSGRAMALEARGVGAALASSGCSSTVMLRVIRLFERKMPLGVEDTEVR
jgi:hypothetical protein